MIIEILLEKYFLATSIDVRFTDDFQKNNGKKTLCTQTKRRKRSFIQTNTWRDLETNSIGN